MDFTGLGESSGEFADSNFSSNVDDLLAAVEWLRAHRSPPQILIGQRPIGGFTELYALDRSGDLDRLLDPAA